MAEDEGGQCSALLLVILGACQPAMPLLVVVVNRRPAELEIWPVSLTETEFVDPMHERVFRTRVGCVAFLVESGLHPGLVKHSRQTARCSQVRFSVLHFLAAVRSRGRGQQVGSYCVVAGSNGVREMRDRSRSGGTRARVAWPMADLFPAHKIPIFPGWRRQHFHRGIPAWLGRYRRAVW